MQLYCEAQEPVLSADKPRKLRRIGVKWITLGIALVLSGCGGTSGSSSDPSVVAQAAVASGTRVAFVGDSITEYWDSIAQPPLKQLVPGEFNDGISGNTTGDMLARFDAVLAQKPEIVVILGGVNDIRLLADPTIDNITAMADKAAASGARVVIATIPPSHIWTISGALVTEATNDAAITLWNSQLRSLAASYGYTIVDYYTALLGPDGQQNPALFFDEVHPNAAGFNAIWKVLEPILTQAGYEPP